jgi:integrase
MHDLRHSCASFLLAAGASPRTVMKTLGHSQIGLTMNTYTHVLPDLERAAVEAAAASIAG